MKLTRKILINLYVNKKLSCAEIAKSHNCSPQKVDYWLKKFHIPKRSISEAIYARHNPKGDPFSIRYPQTITEGILYGMGFGLYWGEGNKKDKASIRLGNTDPNLVKKFIEFLEKFFLINKKKLKFGLQIFNDMKKKDSLLFWRKKLQVGPEQFQKVIITPSRGEGTYREKSKYGVLTVYFNNKKLKGYFCKRIESI